MSENMSMGVRMSPSMRTSTCVSRYTLLTTYYLLLTTYYLLLATCVSRESPLYAEEEPCVRVTCR